MLSTLLVGGGRELVQANANFANKGGRGGGQGNANP